MVMVGLGGIGPDSHFSPTKHENATVAETAMIAISPSLPAHEVLQIVILE
jgi:hypothetical protein